MNRKFGAELFGTAVLVYVACGVAVLTLGTWHSEFGTGAGIVATSLAFGLVLTGLAYAIGPVSGAHVNPAVTMGVLVAKRMSLRDAVGYVAARDPVGETRRVDLGVAEPNGANARSANASGGRW